MLEIIKAGVRMPPGMFIFEDPPDHNLHRGVLSRVFTPRRTAAIAPEMRAFAARSLDPLVDQGGFDFIADLGAPIPCAPSGCSWAFPRRTRRPSGTGSTRE